MTKPLLVLAAACTLFSISSTAFAGLPCPFNDKKHAEGTKLCRNGTIQQCKDGQWVDLGMKCSTPKFQEDERAAAPALERILGESRHQPNFILARLARQS
jgi:hypothetical protein